MRVINKIILFLTFFVLYTSSYAATIGTSNEAEQVGGFIEILSGIFTTDLLLKIIFAIVSILSTLLVSKLIKTKLFDYLERKAGSEEEGRVEMIAVITRSVNVTILLIGFTVTLSVLGIDLGIFIGGIGFGIGFTLKSFLTNFVAGIMMVTEGAYHVGDIVTIGGGNSSGVYTGKIKKINSLYTSIEQFDGVIFNIPNISFMEDPVTNFHTNDKRRVEIDVGVDYATDLVKAKQIMKQIAESFPYILKSPDPDIFVQEFGENSIRLSLRFWINSKDNFFEIKSNVTETVNHLFKENNILIAFPQVVLSTRAGDKVLEKLAEK